MQTGSYQGRLLIATIAGAAVLTPSLVHAWGCEGHQTVALIAAAQLNDRARAKADTLLTNNPIRNVPDGPSRFCVSKGLTFFADAATWADDIRNTQFDTWHSGEWHFLDVPRGETREHLDGFCGSSGCVTHALSDQIKILKSHAKGEKKAAALRFIIHFVGDIHQPLHCATNGDRGGNCVPVSFPDGSAIAGVSGSGEHKLHAVWDTDMIRTYLPKGNTGTTTKIKQYAGQLSQKFAAQIPSWKSGVDLDEWAWESHELAENVTYGKLPTPIPIEPNRPVSKTCKVGSDDVKKRMAAFHETIEQAYVDASQPVIEEQLAKAGTRLALVLNEVWP